MVQHRAMVNRMSEFNDQIPSLAQVRREGAEDAGRRFLEALHAEHGDNVSAIARAAKSSRLQVKTYMKRYGIGRYAKGEKV
jgi:transcriptional regulator with GAF, ATPase, and Fis domain